MRKAQYSVPGKSGKSGEVVFYYFGSGGAGGVKANVDRWMKQFENPQGQSVKTETINGHEGYLCPGPRHLLKRTPVRSEDSQPRIRHARCDNRGQERSDLRQDDRSEGCRRRPCGQVEEDGYGFAGKVAFESSSAKFLSKPSATAWGIFVNQGNSSNAFDFTHSLVASLSDPLVSAFRICTIRLEKNDWAPV